MKPQIIYIIFAIIGMLMFFYDLFIDEESDGKIFITVLMVIRYLIVFGLLTWGGFFDCFIK